jgi:hypothetical protein
MNNLHSLHPVSPAALIWFQPRDGRGHALGKPRGHRYDFENHLYRVERSIPPPLPPEEEPMTPWLRQHHRTMRETWQPYNIIRWHQDNWEHPTIDFIKHPMCGPIRTQARNASLYPTHNRWGQPTLCPQCLAIDRGNLQADLIQEDPWQELRRNGQTDLPDPISGQ